MDEIYSCIEHCANDSRLVKEIKKISHDAIDRLISLERKGKLFSQGELQNTLTEDEEKFLDVVVGLTMSIWLADYHFKNDEYLFGVSVLDIPELFDRKDILYNNGYYDGITVVLHDELFQDYP